MSALTSALQFFQSLDRSLVSLGYSAELATADFRGDNIHFVLEVTGDIYDDEGDYATAELTVKDNGNSAKAWVRDARGLLPVHQGRTRPRD